MPIIKANEPLPQRPVVIGIYGEPGSRKTSLSNTAEKPLLLDFDRGVARSFGRKDTLVVDNWEEVLKYEQEGYYRDFKTIIIDTAKAALDDFLMAYVVRNNFKLATNKLQAYGAIGDEFKRFLNARREEGVDVIIIAHAKKDEDTKKAIPDVTGQSYNLIVRCSDQIGYSSFKNNLPVLQWYPTDLTVGKNTANLAEAVIPDRADPAFKNFMASIVADVKRSITEQNEEQREALEKSEKYQEQINACEDPDMLTKILETVHELPAYLKLPLQKVLGERAKQLGFVANKESKRFEKPNTTTAETKAENIQNDASQKDEFLKSSFDERCRILGELGMIMELDRAVIGPVTVLYENLGKITEEEFNDLLVTVNDAIKESQKSATKKGSRKTAAV